MKIKKGDKVQIIAGDDKGVVAEVVAALPRSNRVIVEGVNVVKRHTKPNNANPDGGIINKELPINVSNELPLLDVKTDISGGKKGGQLFIAFPNGYESTIVTLLVGDNLIKYQTDRNGVIAINDRNEVRTIERRGFVVVDDR